MRVITWNCNMAFRKKAASILACKPDILIVQECEHPDKLVFGPNVPRPADILWFGANPHKGLGIFSYSDFRFRLLKTYNPDLRFVIPIAVSSPRSKFTLYAVWAHNPDDPDGQYVEQIWKAIHHYSRQIRTKNTMLAGDFNSNTIWDRKYREGNHSNVVKKLAKKGIHSSYHLHHGQTQGKEEHATFYLYRHKDKPYHLDYCFISADLAGMLQSIEIGDYDQWMPLSDHTPVIITFRADAL